MKRTKYGRCAETNMARLVRKTKGFRDSINCEYCWTIPANKLPKACQNRLSCPLLPNSKRRPAKEVK